MRTRALKLGVALGALLFTVAAPAFGASKNVKLVDNIPEAKHAPAVDFMPYSNGRDVMLVTGRFGLKSYSLADPANPVLLDEITAESLRLPGDPPVDFSPDASPRSTFWQNEDMDIDRKRKLVLISATRGPTPAPHHASRARPTRTARPTSRASTCSMPGQPKRVRILSFQQLPTGHTTTCINGCDALWTGGPASTTTQRNVRGWTFGRPIIVTDLSNPRKPHAFPMNPVDLFRRDGVTAYSHDVQVDDAGIAWVSGDGGTRGYWTQGRHYDPVEGRTRAATALEPIPYAGGGLAQAETNDATGGFEHNAWRPVGGSAPRGDARYRRGELLLATEEDFGPAADGCRDQGKFTIASLEGSYGGEAWRSTPQSPFRLKTVGKWSPYGEEGARPRPVPELADFCSAHYCDVDGNTVSYAWYGEGTGFLDISNPANPTQFAYWRPDDGIVWASYLHKGYVYTADRTRGVGVLRLTGGASAARSSGRGVAVAAPSARHRRFLARVATRFKPDPGTAFICLIETG